MSDPAVVIIARQAVAAHERGIAGVAKEIGYSRTTLSLYLSGDYGNGEKIEAALLSRYNRRVCPHTEEEVAPEYCRKKALAPKPYGGAARERHWQACQDCPHKPVKEES